VRADPRRDPVRHLRVQGVEIAHELTQARRRAAQTPIVEKMR
jgi:hypothetical protein